MAAQHEDDVLMGKCDGGENELTRDDGDNIAAATANSRDVQGSDGILEGVWGCGVAVGSVGGL